MNSNFSEAVTQAFLKDDTKELDQLYAKLSEETNVERAKGLCSTLAAKCFDTIVDVITDDKKSILVKFYAWHFLQLMTCCPSLKEQLENNGLLLPCLVDLNMKDWDDEKMKSLQIISLNYIIFMIGSASDIYYDHVTTTNTISYIYHVISRNTLTGDNSILESAILAVNLLLEGTSPCKQQLVELEFSKLFSKKIEERTDCPPHLLKIANLTHQKLLLLSSDQKAFVETFRQGFVDETKKQQLFQPIVCHNESCCETDISSMKRCSRCKKVLYCSKECQIKHWKSTHRKLCCSTD